MNNSRSLLGIVIVTIGLIGSLWVTVSVITDERNALAQFAGYMVAGSLIAGLLFGGRALALLLVIFAFGDLVKRGLILFGSLSYIDIGKVLAAGPLLLAGICVNMLWGALSGRVQMSRFHWLVFVGCCLVTITSAIYDMMHYSSLMLGLKNVALGSSYAMLPWVVVTTLQTPDQIKSFLKTFLIVFLPVALYGISQGVFGLSDFEVDYLKSGYTIESRQLNNEVVRKMSTMNAPRSLSITMAMCMMFLVSLRVCKAKSWTGLFHPVSVLLLPIFGLAMVYTLTRVGWVAAIIFPVLVVAFAGKVRVGLLYGIGITSVGVLVLFSEPILKEWETITNYSADFFGADTAFGRQATNINTLSARLVGLRNLTKDTKLWSAFGVDENTLENMEDVNLDTGRIIDQMSTGMTHDVVSHSIVKYGLVPSFLALVAVIFLAKWFHGLPFRMKDPGDKRLTVMLLASLVTVGISGLSSSMHVPINALFFIVVGMVLSMAAYVYNLENAPADEAVTDAAVPVVPRVGVPEVEASGG